MRLNAELVLLSVSDFTVESRTANVSLYIGMIVHDTTDLALDVVYFLIQEESSCVCCEVVWPIKVYYCLFSQPLYPSDIRPMQSARPLPFASGQGMYRNAQCLGKL